MKSRWPILLLCAFAAILTFAVQQGISTLRAQTELPASVIYKGFGYAAYDLGVFSSAESDAQLEEMAEMGADSVSIVGSVYQDNVNSTDIFSYEDTTPAGQTPLYPSTPSDADFAHVISKAHSLGMTVKLKIHVDLQNGAGKWRGDIGESFSSSQWIDWFDSYTAIMVRYAILAETHNVETFTIGTELEQTVRRTEWFDVIDAVKAVYSGKITYAANWGNELEVIFWHLMDYIGVDAYYDLTDIDNPNIVELEQAWVGPVARLKALNDANNLPILFSEIGYINADGNNQNPWCFACSALSDVPDPEEQALLFEALFKTISAEDYIQGVYVWGIAEGDGGPCNIGYTVRDKPAENVIRQWYGAETRPEIEETCTTSIVTPIPPGDPNAVPTPTPQPLTIRPVESVTYTAPISPNIPYKGMGYAQHRADAYSEPISDDTVDAIAATGAEWISILVTWYQDTGLTTQITSDTIKSPTDIDITHVISKAHSVGLKVLLKPHVDLQDTRNGDWWRGEIGLQPDKTPGWADGSAEWDAWFASYQNFINYYAAMAEAQNVEMFAVGTELVNATKPARTNKWIDVIDGVKAIYNGPLTYAANHSGEEFHIEFWQELDLIGVDAYYSLDAEGPAPTVDALKDAWNPTFGASLVDDLASLADINAGAEGDGQYMPLIFTEIGYRSLDESTEAPWYSGFSTNQVDLGEQADAYQALLEVFTAQPWFEGVFWWSYEFEPEASGACNSGFSPHAKPAENVVRAWYGVAQRPEIEALCSVIPEPTPIPTPRPVIIPPPAGFGPGAGFADLDIYKIPSPDLAKEVTQVFTLDYINGLVPSVGLESFPEGGNKVPDPEQFEVGLQEKRVRDYRATEICGYIVPPISGNYQFAVAGDDEGWFMLSSDETGTNEAKIASFPGWAQDYQWDKYPEYQISDPVVLQAGQPYRFRIFHINRTGGDRVEAGWKGPGFNMQLISEEYLWPCSEAAPTAVPTEAGPTNTPAPTNTPVPPATNTPVPPEPTATTLPGEPTSTPAPTNTSVPLPTSTPAPVEPTATTAPADPTATTVPADPTATPVSTNADPSIQWNTTTVFGEPGSQILLMGTGFPAGDTLTISVTNADGKVSQHGVVVDADGSFDVGVITADDITPGAYKFNVEGYSDLVIADLIIGVGLPMLPPVTATQTINLPAADLSGGGGDPVDSTSDIFLPIVSQ